MNTFCSFNEMMVQDCLLVSVEVFLPFYSGQIDFHPVVSDLLKPSFALQLSRGNTDVSGISYISAPFLYSLPVQLSTRGNWVWN